MYLSRNPSIFSWPRSTFRRVALLAACGLTTVLLSACVNDDMSDLRAHKEKILARKSTKVEALPEVKPFDIFTYVPGERKDPFKPLFEDEPPEITQVAAVDNGLSPDPNRIKQELEQFPLDSLRMVGTLESTDTNWAIVISNDGTVHRVKAGDYLGQNHGKIVAVEEDVIELNEVVSNGLGGYQERTASLALIE